MDRGFQRMMDELGKVKETPHQYAERKAKNILERELRLPPAEIKSLLEETYKRRQPGMTHEDHYGHSYQRALKRHQEYNRERFEREKYERERPEREAKARQMMAEYEAKSKEARRKVEEMKEMEEAKKRGYAEMDTGYDSGTGSESERESAEEQRVRAMNLHKKREETPAQQPPADQVAPGMKDLSLVFGERHAEPGKKITGSSTGYGVHKVIGEGNASHKLTVKEVQEIRTDWWSRPHIRGQSMGDGLIEVGEKYGVSPSTINSLLQRKSWYNLPFIEGEPTEERLNVNEKRLVKIFKEKYGGTREQMVRNKQGRLALPPEIALKEKAEASEKAKAKRTELTEEERKEKNRITNEKRQATKKANKEKKLAEGK